MKVSVFHDRLKEAMAIRGLRAVDLCRITGFGRSLISQYASGVRHPKQDNIYILAKALNVDEGWLMGYGYSMEREPQPEENDIKRINSDECALLNDYRQLNDKGKEYIRQTMTIARNTYQKTSH